MYIYIILRITDDACNGCICIKTFTMKIKKQCAKGIEILFVYFGDFLQIIKRRGIFTSCYMIVGQRKAPPTLSRWKRALSGQLFPQEMHHPWNIVGMIFDAVVSLEECVCGFW